jgi:hypothetical protein
MTVFAGHYGAIELQRIGSGNALNLLISPENIDTGRKRIAFSTPEGKDIEFGLITTGDRLRITTSDARGLPLRLYTNAANTSYIDNPSGGVLPLEFFANVDAMGQIRMYRTFKDAMANSGASYLAIPLAQSSSAAPWSIKVTQITGDYNFLGAVEGFTINTERNSVDTTALGDQYQNFQAAQINGSGSVDCKFDFKNINAEEMPIALCQLIQKIEIGSLFKGKFYLLEPGSPQPAGYTVSEGVYYELNGIMTKAGVEVRADQIVECSFDFVVNGEFKLRAGAGATDLVTEDNVSIGKESTLDQLGVLQESN